MAGSERTAPKSAAKCIQVEQRHAEHSGQLQLMSKISIALRMNRKINVLPSRSQQMGSGAHRGGT